VSKGVESLKDLVYEFHRVHGVGGDFLSCVECVIAALNQSYVDSVQDVKDRFDGV
jgi:hypothetical protein